MEAADDGTTEATIDSIIAMTNQQEIPAEPGDDEEVNVWQVREVMAWEGAALAMIGFHNV